MVTKYICNICNYETSKRSNYSRHIGSLKHQKKVVEGKNIVNYEDSKLPTISSKVPTISSKLPFSTENEQKLGEKMGDKYVCEFCGTGYSRSSSLWKHKNKCYKKKIEDIQNEYKAKESKLINKENEYILKLELKDDKIELLESDLIYYKNLIKTAGVGSGAKITTNVQSLIVSKHDDAPAIEYAKPNLLKFNSKDAYENSLFLVNRYKDNTFTMFVGKCIVAACKKEDPDEQSVWSTDANRLTMFIKKMMDDDSKWISDKKGVQTTKYLINPILQKIKEMLIDYNKHLYSQISKLPQHEVDYYNDIMIHCRELVHFIEHEKLADEILKYMAPRLTYEIK